MFLFCRRWMNGKMSDPLSGFFHSNGRRGSSVSLWEGLLIAAWWCFIKQMWRHLLNPICNIWITVSPPVLNYSFNELRLEFQNLQNLKLVCNVNSTYTYTRDPFNSATWRKCVIVTFSVWLFCYTSGSCFCHLFVGSLSVKLIYLRWFFAADMFL